VELFPEETLRDLGSVDSTSGNPRKIRNKFRSNLHKGKIWDLPEVINDKVVVPGWMKKANKNKWKLDLGWTQEDLLVESLYDLNFGYELTTEPESSVTDTGRSL